MTPELVLHQQIRGWRATLVLLVAVASFVSSPLHPAIREALGVDVHFTWLLGAACSLGVCVATAAYRRYGQASRAYAVANALETTTFTVAVAAIICASNTATNPTWFLYGGHLVHCGTAGFQRRFNAWLFVVVPALMVLWFLGRGHPGDAALTFVFGLFSVYTYQILARTASRLRQTIIERDALALELRVQEERQRIASDLHDGVGNDLAALHWQLEGLRASMPPDDARERFFSTLRGRLDKGAEELRNIVWELRSGDLAWHELVSRLKARGEELCGDRLRFGIRSEGQLEAVLPALIHMHVARIVQESVRNAVKHSRASHIEVHLRLADSVEIEVTDDGIGLEPQQRGLREGGLRNMERRAGLLHGTFAILERPAGTCIRATVPLSASTRARS